ncbi:carboxymuconolactone decarboxylase family protein [Actinospica robiniae]|uniref:carboxymuconolactone decarboxylase family protein n=1 Tax=Actinospica robiniae TaxID=304901 RepID=UPI000416ACF6|nr:peroxidase-related enzyme [Actinospica robiniae]
MPHIFLDPNLAGIRSLLDYRKETAKALMDLAEVLLRGDSPLTRGERELIAAYVSEQNDCEYCAASHGACAAMLLPEGTPLVDQVRKDPAQAAIDDKLRALLAIAGSVAQGGWAVSEEQIAAARAAGAEDRDIHDTVLVAAAFCMYNRYVDGLATLTPHDPAAYAVVAERLVNQGYAIPRQAPAGAVSGAVSGAGAAAAAASEGDSAGSSASDGPASAELKPKRGFFSRLLGSK